MIVCGERAPALRWCREDTVPDPRALMPTRNPHSSGAGVQARVGKLLQVSLQGTKKALCLHLFKL
jgi:hypothetical protein